MISIVQSVSNPTILYSLLEGLHAGRLFRSQDRGDHWSQVYQFNSQMNGLAVDPANLDLLYTGSSDGLLRSKDSGAHWDTIYPLAEQYAAPAADTVFTLGRIASKPASCLDPSGEYVLAQSFNAGVDWQTKDIGCFYSMNRLAVANGQPDIIYIAAGEWIPGTPKPMQNWVLVTSQNGGLTWQSYPLPGYAGNLIVDPQNPQELFATSYSHLITSHDGGQHWDENLQYRLAADDYSGDPQLSIRGNELYAIPVGELSQPLYRSQDRGKTWWQSLGALPSGARSLIPDAQQPGRLFAGLFGYGIYSSEDNGASWSPANTGIQTIARIVALEVAPSDPGLIYAGSDYPRPALFRSTDAGQSWSPPLLDSLYLNPNLQPGKQAFRTRKIAIHPQNPTIVWVGGRDGLIEHTVDDRWGRLFSGGINDLAVSSAFPDQLFVLMDQSGSSNCATAYRTPLIGLIFTWRVYPSPGICPTALAIDPFQKGKILTAGSVSTNFGLAIDVFSSKDGGQSYQKVSQILPENMIVGLRYSPNLPGVVLAWTTDTRNPSHLLWMSQDDGKTWTPWSEGLAQGAYEPFLEISPYNTAYYGSVGVFKRSLNGATWEPIGLDGQEITAMALSTGQTGFLVTATEQGLWRLDIPTYSICLPIVARD